MSWQESLAPITLYSLHIVNRTLHLNGPSDESTSPAYSMMFACICPAFGTSPGHLVLVS